MSNPDCEFRTRHKFGAKKVRRMLVGNFKKRSMIQQNPRDATLSASHGEVVDSTTEGLATASVVTEPVQKIEQSVKEVDFSSDDADSAVFRKANLRKKLWLFGKSCVTWNRAVPPRAVSGKRSSTMKDLFDSFAVLCSSGQPCAVVVTALSSSELAVFWKPPANLSQPIRGYDVSVGVRRCNSSLLTLAMSVRAHGFDRFDLVWIWPDALCRDDNSEEGDLRYPKTTFVLVQCDACAFQDGTAPGSV
ncbi:hypothetical protein MRX96_021529 [Rhipicephalus microplus]